MGRARQLCPGISDLDPVLKIMMRTAHQYEGTVIEVMGDGIMAMRPAHEDHAVRACYAALRMRPTVRRNGVDASGDMEDTQSFV
jgi:class 3 adenylate cyclase